MKDYYDDEHKYDDIINLPHHQSATRPHMSLHDRAAQFAPFAALSGHEEVIEETGRLTEERIELEEAEKEILNRRLQYLAEMGAGIGVGADGRTTDRQAEVSITYFKPDSRKGGGAYLTDIGAVKKIDFVNREIIMRNGVRIPTEQIVEIGGECFEGF